MIFAFIAGHRRFDPLADFRVHLIFNRLCLCSLDWDWIFHIVNKVLCFDLSAGNSSFLILIGSISLRIIELRLSLIGWHDALVGRKVGRTAKLIDGSGGWGEQLLVIGCIVDRRSLIKGGEGVIAEEVQFRLRLLSGVLLLQLVVILLLVYDVHPLLGQGVVWIIILREKVYLGTFIITYL